MRTAVRVRLPTRARAPCTAENIGKRARCHAVRIVGADVPRADKTGILRLLRCNREIDRKGFQNMLIGARRVRIANLDDLLAHCSADTVGDDAVGRKVSAADHIARARRRKAHTAVHEETLPIAVDRKLRAALACRIRIVAHERLVLAVAPRPLLVLIHLIRRHDEHGAHCVRHANTFEQIDRAHHICRKCIDGLTVALAHNRLCREVQHNLGFRLIKCA